MRAHCPRLCDRCPLRPAPSRLRALSSARLLTHASLVPCSCVRRVLERRVVFVPEQRSQNNWLFRADRNMWFSTRAWAGCGHTATGVSLQLLVPVGSSERLHRIARRAESAKAALGLTYQLHPLSCSALAICFVVPRVTARTRASNTATRASLPDRHARRQQFVRQRLPSGCCNVSPRPSTTTQSGLVSQGGGVLPMLCYDECCRAVSTVSRTLCDVHVALHGVSDRQIKVLRPSATKLWLFLCRGA